MQKILAATLAAAGFMAVSQVCFATALAPASANGNAQENTQIVLARNASGGGMSHGSMGMSRGGMGMKQSGMGMSRGGVRNFSAGRSAMMGHSHHHHHHFRGGGFYGFGWGFGDPYTYGYDTSSCYWNCRSEGYGPTYCRINAWEYCN
jgi:hypothetical protein